MNASESTENDASLACWIGRILAPLLALAVYWMLPSDQGENAVQVASSVGIIASPLGDGPLSASSTLTFQQHESRGLSDAGRATAAIAVLMAILWLTEALPLPATSLLLILLFPLCNVLPIRDASAPYAREYIFLFMGGFLLALAMERWNLHRRVALLTVLAFGTRPTRLIAGMMIASAFLSMWISNTATTVLMLPIGLSLANLVGNEFGRISDTQSGSDPSFSNFGTCLMLGIAYAASIGGMGTIVGSPPNLFLVSYAQDQLDLTIGFGRWMLVGVPLAFVFLAICWYMLTNVIYPIRIADLPGGSRLIRDELAKLGPLSRGERTVLIVFIATALAWMFREPITNWDWLTNHVPALSRLHDAGIALAAALILFAVPIDARKGIFALDWETARKLPWGVLLLFGGGLSLAAAFQESGLSEWIGNQVKPFGHLPPFVIVIITTASVLYLTELTSNTATATTFFPILAGVAIGLDVEPLLLLLPAGLAASCAFMMPVATPPNAIVFGSGHIRLWQMVRAGFWLNLIGLALILGTIYLVSRWGVI